MKHTWRPAVGPGAWRDVETLHYREAGSAVFKGITRKVLFDHPSLAGQLRYFEVEAGGYSTLEHHHHLHAVLVLRGRGRCLVGDELFELGPHDLVMVPSMAWHQFQAAPDEPLGFLCLVNTERDRPILPTQSDLAGLRRDGRIGAFIRV
ncbi:MAG TPA: cupin domain-containing protein [Anaeromyxobacteraceae bacterium]|nr:cupin domain-containing protein [Anaeromyxobacteraceae bacterium]